MTSVAEQRAPSRKERLTKKLDRALNPFLVKDMRGWLRSKRFLIVFFAALGLTQMVTLAGIIDATDGKDIFAVLVAGLAFILVGLVPFFLQDKFARELSSGSTELALVSRVTASQMIRGKIMSGLAANLLFFSAVGPSLVIAYMLGGVDPFLLLYALLATLAMSAFAMVLGILMVSILGRTQVKVLSLALIGAGLGAAALLFAICEIDDLSRNLMDKEFLTVNGIIAVEAILGGLFFFNVARSRVDRGTVNPDMGQRLTLSLWALGSLLAGIGTSIVADLAFGSSKDDRAMFWALGLIFSVAAFTLGFFFIANTSARISGRLLDKLPKNPIARALLLPGEGRLMLFVLVHFLIFGVAAAFNVNDDKDMVGGMAWTSAAYYLICSCYLAYRIVKKLFFKGRNIRAGLTMFVAAIIWSAVGAFMLIVLDHDNVLLVASPISAFIYSVDEVEQYGKMLLLTSPWCLTATFMWLTGGLAAHRDLQTRRFEKAKPEPEPADE